MRRLMRERYTRLRLQVALRDLPRVQELCGDTVTLTQVERRGLQVVLATLARESAQILCMVLALLAMGHGQSRLWEIRIASEDPILSGRLRTELAELQLRPGMPIGDIDLRRLEKELQLRFPDLAFAQTDLTGTTLTLTPMAREDTEAETFPESGHLLSGWDAVVEKVTVRAGTPRVAEGDPVQKGAILIEGITSPTPDLAEPRLVTAKGSVLARVWIHATAVQEETPRTRSEAHSRYSLRLGTLRIPLGPTRDDLHWELSGVCELPGPWDVSPLGIERHTAFLNEEAVLDREAHLRVLSARSAKDALSQLPRDAEILSITQTHNEEDADPLCVQTLIEARIQIAQYP